MVVILLLGLFELAYAQQWQAVNPPLNPFNGTIYTTEVDASGNIYAGGEFKNSAQKYTVVKWDGKNWSELGNGTSSLNATNWVYALATRGDTVYAAGAFTNSSGKNYVAKWNGISWTELGLGTGSLNANSSIFSISIDKTGNLYAAGSFTNASGKNYVAKWNGTAWVELGVGTNALNANNAIFSLATDAAGNVYAGGYFTNATGKIFVAKWNGTTWSELGNGMTALNANGFIGSITTDNSGNIYTGGNFRNSDNKYYVAKWNGVSWSELGAGSNSLGANNNINSIAVKNENEIYAAGIFTNGNGSYYVAKWNGATWSELNNELQPFSTNDHVESITLDKNNHLFIGGKFTNKSGNSFVAQWDGTVWGEPDGKADPFYNPHPIYQIASDSINHVYVSGYFPDDEKRYLKHWNGKTWQPLKPETPGLLLLTENENKIAVDRKGNLYAVGRKVTAGITYDCILKWDGLQWNIVEDVPNALGLTNNLPGSSIGQIKIDFEGNLYVSGSFNDRANGHCLISKWDGKTWSGLAGSSGAFIQNFCIARDGNIYAYGGFTNEIGRSIVVNYNPANRNWTELKTASSQFAVAGYNVLKDIAVDSNNNVYVNGLFRNAADKRYVAKWNGVGWSELGTTNNLGVYLAIDKKNSIYANQTYTETNFYPVAKWSGTSWTGLGSAINPNGIYPKGNLLSIDAAGVIYTDDLSDKPGVGVYLARYAASTYLLPQLTSFSPATGSVGTTVTIKGKNLAATSNVSFGGVKAGAFTIENDSTVTAVVASGATGSVVVETPGGIDSLKSFIYTCDSVKGPIPTITLYQDSLLRSSTANHYQWFFNSQLVANQNTNQLRIKSAGFYQVKTSVDKVCWVPSLDYPVLISQNPLSDSLRLLIYPNPSDGQFTVYLRTPQIGSMKVFLQVADMSGVLILQSNKFIFYGNEIKIPVNITNKGTYVVKIYVNDKVSQQTIIIM